jgi:elongation factor Ts
MPEISAEMVKSLREATGAGIMDVKRALQDAGGDVAKATATLRAAGAKIAAKKQERTAGEGIVANYVHAGGKLATLVELRCETDFVARNEDFLAVARDIAMHIAASDPQYLRAEDVPEQILEAEREVYRQQVATEGKSAEIADKIVAGKLDKFYTQVCLLRQPFVKDDSMTVAQVIEQITAKVGEKIEIGQFARIQVQGKSK